MKYLLTIIALLFMLQGNAQKQDFRYAKVHIIKKEHRNGNFKLKLEYYNKYRKVIKRAEVYVAASTYNRVEKDHFYT